MLAIRPSLKNSTLLHSHERELLRVKIMRENFPNENFSLHPSHLYSDKTDKRFWRNYPLVKFRQVYPSDRNASIIIESYLKYKDFITGYVSFNSLKFDTGLSFEEVFAFVCFLKKLNKVSWSVNRAGDAVFVKFKC